MARFDFTMALAKRTSSTHTHRAYYRWIDRFLVDVAQYKPATGPARVRRMANLSIPALQRHLKHRKLESWLAKLVEENQSRQGLDQARAAVVTLAELAQEYGHILPEETRLIQEVSVPPVERKTTPERLLSAKEMKTLMSAMTEIASSENQRARNNVIAALVWSLALRREELSALRWGDIVLRDNRPALRLGVDYLEIPRPALVALDRWRACFTGNIQDPPAESPLLRRIWKGGRIAREGLSPDGVWLIIHQAAIHSRLGTVTPDDLRRSVIASMREGGATARELNRLLRHRSLIITERFLTRLGRPGEGPDTGK
jgi:integrase